jgi:serine/threonine protein kinase
MSGDGIESGSSKVGPRESVLDQNWDQQTNRDGSHENANTPTVKNSVTAPLSQPTAVEKDCETGTSYRNLDWHASGGLGVIYKARDPELRRDVALKFLRDRSTGGSTSADLFENEAKITAQLGHPGVVPIYGIGQTQDGGCPFYAMRFIEGRKLSEVIADYHAEDRRRGRRLDPQSTEFRKLIARMVFVCSTVQYAHHRGVIHLDIKPDNVMVGQFDETLLVDWGLATKVSRDEIRQHPIFKSIDSGLSDLESNGPKSSGEGPGTPAYFSPEQASKNCDLTFATDVYLLGATLYHVLTGVAPLADSTSRFDVLLKAREGEFGKPSELRPGVPRELEEICLKAMHKKPRERYATARDMAIDLENYLSDVPVTAHHDTWWERSFRWTRHHRSITRFAMTLMVILGALFGFFSLYKSRVADHERSMRESTLKVAARFAARGLGEEIENRWLILQHAAAKPELIKLLDELKSSAKFENGRMGCSTNPTQTIIRKLDQWLRRHSERTAERTAAANWYLFDGQGYLIGRYPHGSNYAKIIGKNFAFRSHFHGEEQDQTDKEKALKEAAPVEGEFLSSAFVSTGDNNVKVAFSVPVRRARIGDDDSEDNGKPLAVLGMNVEPGRFQFLNFGDGQDDLEAILVDTKIANLDKTKPAPEVAEDFRGLVLHHPRLNGKLIGFSEPYVQERFAKLLQQNGRQTLTATVVSDHLDPVDDASVGQRLAIYEPVLFENHRSTDGHGLIVIIQERKANRKR